MKTVNPFGHNMVIALAMVAQIAEFVLSTNETGLIDHSGLKQARQRAIEMNEGWL